MLSDRRARLALTFPLPVNNTQGRGGQPKPVGVEPRRRIGTRRELWSASLSDPSGHSVVSGPLTLVLRAAMVPDGELPPPEFLADFRAAQRWTGRPGSSPATMPAYASAATVAPSGHDYGQGCNGDEEAFARIATLGALATDRGDRSAPACRAQWFVRASRVENCCATVARPWRDVRRRGTNRNGLVGRPGA
jgi:hypothetical protein